MLRVSKGRPYRVPVVMHTLDILECLFHSLSPLKLADVVEQTNIAHSTAYRILRTLEERGYVSRCLNGGYRYFKVPTESDRSAKRNTRRPDTSGYESSEALMQHTVETLLSLLEGSKRKHPVPLPLEYRTSRCNNDTDLGK
jgi:predicted transcriptional regulator